MHSCCHRGVLLGTCGTLRMPLRIRTVCNIRCLSILGFVLEVGLEVMIELKVEIEV